MRVLLITIAVVVIPTLTLAQDGIKTWEGTWNNKKYGTSGPLKCVARVNENGLWTATFTGLFKGEPFEYPATFQSRESENQTDLSGKAVIRGHNYEWIGAMKANQLRGRYKSSVGYYGDFSLKEKPDRQR